MAKGSKGERGASKFGITQSNPKAPRGQSKFAAKPKAPRGTSKVAGSKPKAPRGKTRVAVSPI